MVVGAGEHCGRRGWEHMSFADVLTGGLTTPTKELINCRARSRTGRLVKIL